MRSYSDTQKLIEERVGSFGYPYWLRLIRAELQREHEDAMVSVQETVDAIQAFQEPYGNLV